MATKPTDTEFANLVNLLSVFSEASCRLAALEAEITELQLDLVDDKKTEYAELQDVLTRTETALEIVCRAHPEWFQERKSIKTPYGSVSFRRSAKLLVPNKELTIELIRQAERANGETTGFIRTVEDLDLEALEKLDDAALKRLKITRATTDEFGAKPVTLDLGKAVKAAAAREPKAEQEAA